MLTIQDKAHFLRLALALSPENISCDGERSHAQIVKRRASIMAEWRGVEARCGVKVSETESYLFSDEVDAYEREEAAKAIAAAPSHPLLTTKNPDVWTREGANGRSAYYVWGPGKTSSGDYETFSEFAHMTGRRERLGSAATLDGAVKLGEAFLATVTFDSFSKANPGYSPEAVKRELARLPAEYDAQIPAMPPVVGFNVYMSNELILENVSAEEAMAAVQSRLTERGQQVTIRAV